MSRRFSFRLLAIALCFFWASSCGDDDPAPTQNGRDTAADAGQDTPGGDQGDDTVIDDTGTGDVAPDSIIPIGGCEANPEECTADQECIGGGCVDPVEDLEDYTDEAMDRPSSYFWNIQLPSQFTPPERCCFDYTGDGRADDALGGLLGLIATLQGDSEDPMDIPALISEAFYDGTVTLVADHTELPTDGAEKALVDGDARFSLFIGSNDLDFDGEPDDDYDTRVAGGGSFLLNRDSFGDYGAQVQFNLGTVEGATMYAGPAQFNLTIPIPQLAEEPISLTLEAAQIIADISQEDTGVFTDDEWTDLAEPLEDPSCGRVGGCPIGTFCDPGTTTCREVVVNGQLGGVLPAPQLLNLLNEQLLICDCAGVVADADDPNFEFACTAFDCLCTNDALCGTDADDDGVPDACEATDEVGFCVADGCAADVDLDGAVDSCDQSTCDYNEDGIPDACNIITWELNHTLGVLAVSCSDNTGDDAPACGDDDGALCGSVSIICGAMGLIGNVLDVDLDNDGIRESLSAGLRFGWSGAAITGLVPLPE